MNRAQQASTPFRAFALVGPGRAGSAIALALKDRGLTPVAVAGRDPAASSTRAVAAMLDVPPVPAVDAGRDADLVVIATPDSAIAPAAAALATSLERGALVVHLSGSRSLTELDAIAGERSDVEVGSLHPLQSLPSGALGRDRLSGSWCAVDGSRRVERLARSLGMRPFRVADSERVRYHAAACVASNHLVAVLGQVERLARSAGVPLAAFVPLARATLDNVERLGPAAALTGPVARGDFATVARHLDGLPLEELETYSALAREAGRLAGMEAEPLEEVLT